MPVAARPNTWRSWCFRPWSWSLENVKVFTLGCTTGSSSNYPKLGSCRSRAFFHLCWDPLTILFGWLLAGYSPSEKLVLRFLCKTFVQPPNTCVIRAKLSTALRLNEHWRHVAFPLDDSVTRCCIMNLSLADGQICYSHSAACHDSGGSIFRVGTASIVSSRSVCK